MSPRIGQSIDGEWNGSRITPLNSPGGSTRPAVGLEARFAVLGCRVCYQPCATTVCHWKPSNRSWKVIRSTFCGVFCDFWPIDISVLFTYLLLCASLLHQWRRTTVYTNHLINSLNTAYGIRLSTSICRSLILWNWNEVLCVGAVA